MLKPYNKIGRKKIRNLFLDIFILEMGPISCPETSVKKTAILCWLIAHETQIFFYFRIWFYKARHTGKADSSGHRSKIASTWNN